MAGIPIRRYSCVATRLFRQHRVRFHRVVDCHCPIHLAATPLRQRAEALQPLLILHSFRFIGLAFSGPRRRVARFAFFLCAFRGLWRHHSGNTRVAPRCCCCRLGLVFLLAWDLQSLGSADLLNAFYQANHVGLQPGQLGATYFIPTLVVPLLLVTHGARFRMLLQHQMTRSCGRAIRIRRQTTLGVMYGMVEPIGRYSVGICGNRAERTERQRAYDEGRTRQTDPCPSQHQEGSGEVIPGHERHR